MNQPDKPDIAVYPPIVAIVCFLAALVMHWLMPVSILPAFPDPMSIFVGVCTMVLALALVVSAGRAFQAANTNINPHKPALVIVQKGPFRFTRNPMYLGLILVLLGLGICFSLDWALVLAPVQWAVLHFGVVLREEAYLSAKFGPDYQALLDRTRRWL